MSKTGCLIRIYDRGTSLDGVVLISRDIAQSIFDTYLVTRSVISKEGFVVRCVDHLCSAACSIIFIRSRITALIDESRDLADFIIQEPRGCAGWINSSLGTAQLIADEISNSTKLVCA